MAKLMHARAFIPLRLLLVLTALVLVVAASSWGLQLIERAGLELRFSGILPVGWGLLLASVAGALAYWLYRRELTPRGARALLPVIRAAALVLLILMLTGPTLQRRTEIGEKGRALIYVDATQSMEVTDTQMPAGRKLLIAHALGWLGPAALDTTVAEAAETLSRAAEAADELARHSGDAQHARQRGRRLIELAREVAQRLAEHDQPIRPPHAQSEGPTGEVALERWTRPRTDDPGRLGQAAGGRPSASGSHPGLERAMRAGEGLRIRGFLHPPRPGDYELLLEAPGPAQLRISADGEAHNAQRLPEGRRTVRLESGRAHYFEVTAIADEAGALQLGWRKGEDRFEQPIPAAYLSPYTEPAEHDDLRPQVLARLNEDIIAPAGQWAEQPPPPTAQALQALDAIRDATLELRDTLEGAFERQVHDLLTRDEEGRYREALERFDQYDRWKRAQRLLLMDGGFVTGLLEDYEVELRPFGIEETDLLWTSRAEDRPLVPDVLDADPTGPRTDLAAPLRHAARGRDPLPGRRPDGGDDADTDRQPGGDDAGPTDVGHEHTVVILLSDGQHNHDEPGARSPEQVARDLAARGVHLHTIGYGAARPPRDMALLGFREVPEQVFREGKLTGKVRIYEAMPGGLPYTLQIEHEGRMLWQQPMVTRAIPVDVSPEALVREVEFAIDVEEAARAAQMLDGDQLKASSVPLTLDVSITELPGETDLDNNTAVLMTRVVDHQRRVLLIDGRPRWSYRFLRNMFRRDPQWQLNAVLPDFTESPAGRLRRGEGEGMFPPDREALFTYDLIIFGELPRELFREEELQWLAQFVLFRGGGMILVDGPRGHLRDYADSPLDLLLPVRWAQQPLQNPDLQFRVTDLGDDFPALALDGDPDRKARTWANLPTPHHLPQVDPLPGAEVLIEAEQRGRHLPVMVARSTGAGRVFYSATDETFRWRDRVADRYESAFWPSVATWVMETPFHVRDEHVALGLDRVSYEPNQPVSIRARLYDRDARPITQAQVEARIMRGEEVVRRVELEAQDHESGLFLGRTATGEGERLEPGSYTVGLEVTDRPDISTTAQTVFQVLPRTAVQGERALVYLNEARLQRLAREGGGAYYREEQTPALLGRLSGQVERRTIVEEIALWRHFGWFAVIIGLLTVEWILRKRAGMI